MFIDRVHVKVQAGNGGNGCESYFRRLDKKVVPNGGDGGRGGNIVFRADDNAPPLSAFRFKQHLIAESGGHGGSNRKRGGMGEDLVVLVPPGIRIFDRQRDLLIRELLKPGDEVVVMEGGRGGVGNDGGKTASFGQRCEALDLELRIFLTADIFLVGLPNSGKSKILNTLTRSAVKDEPYAFSTREPQVGVYHVNDYEHVTLCELPSIYNASHEGKGLGADFLKHLERAKRIIYVLDPNSEFAGSLQENLETLQDQIKRVNPEFLKRESAIVFAKMDQAEADSKVSQNGFHSKLPILKVSAQEGTGLKELKEYMACVNS